MIRAKTAVVLAAVMAAGLFAAEAAGQGGAEPNKVVKLDISALKTPDEFKSLLKQHGLAAKGYVNWYTLRWPNISFIGGMAMGNDSEDMEFFYEKPFRWWGAVLDYVMEGGGRVYGVRVRYRRYKGTGAKVRGGRSYLFYLRGEVMSKKGYHPSYILANGRRIWDAKKHPLLDGKIYAPFWHEKTGDVIIDMVVDRRYTPKVKGLSFRNGHLQPLGAPGVAVVLKGATGPKEASPADKLKRFAFGLFPSGYDFWTNKGPTFAQIKQAWKPNFRPSYPVDEVWLSPHVFTTFGGNSAYHKFMMTYGGGNLAATNPAPAILEIGKGYIRGVLMRPDDAAAAKNLLQKYPWLQVHWMAGESPALAERSKASHAQAMSEQAQARKKSKQATGLPDKIVTIYEPFAPALTAAHEYERGNDVLVLKNEEDPQYNILMSMSRGAGRTFGKPFGFYWEQTHYPFPSADEKLHCCMLYFLCGGSWIGAELENAPAFSNGVVADWVFPYVQALRFAMMHPARGEPIVPVGVLWTYGDRWWIPYNPFGQMDTFQRYIEYDHATGTLKCPPAFLKPLHYVPTDRSKWNFNTAGHVPYFIDHLDELKGYDLLDVFFPKYGDAFTARITRLLTGTPYGPVDFVYGDKASAEHLASFGMIAVLGHASIDKQLEAKLARAVGAGTAVLFGAQHMTSGGVFGVSLNGQAVAVKGPVTGPAELYKGKRARFAGKVYGFRGGGWRTVAAVGGKPLVISKKFRKGRAYVYLGQWIHQGADALRPILAAMGRQAAPLRFEPADDQMEYVAYRKGAGAWVALFNHGGIPIGCDRLKKLRATPPEPLVSKVKGPWEGKIQFRLDKLGLDPKGDYSLYEVAGIDGEAFEQVISGHKTFTVKKIESQREGGVITASVGIAKRGQYVIAPEGKGEAVFFGKP